MNKFLLLFFTSTIGYSQPPESEPTFYSEITERVAPRDYYIVKFGIPTEVIINDTIFMANSETWIEKNVYSFNTRGDEMLVKKYRNGLLIADERIELDPNNRILNYEGNLKYEDGKWYITKVKYKYETKKLKKK